MVYENLENSNDLSAQILFLYGKNTLSKLDRTVLLHKLDNSVPGNKQAKLQLLLMISQAYANKDFSNSSAIMLTGNSGVGKSSVIKSIGELTNIPIVRFDLENILETSSSGKVDDSLAQSIFDTLYEDVQSISRLNAAEKRKYSEYKRALPKDLHIENTLILKEKPNAEFTIIEFDNSEILLDTDQNKSSSSKMLQLALVDLIKKPVLIEPAERSTKNFIYVFSADLCKPLAQKGVGFRPCIKDYVDNGTLINLGYSKRFVDLFNQVITLNDLSESDFEHYLQKQDSHLHKSIFGLANTYGVNVVIDDSAIKVVSKYLVSNKKNLKGIEEVTRKLLAPHYLSPKKGTKIVIDSAIASERLYS